MLLRKVRFKRENVASLQGGVPSDIRWSFTQWQPARRSFEKLLSWDFDKLDHRPWGLRRERRETIGGTGLPVAQVLSECEQASVRASK